MANLNHFDATRVSAFTSRTPIPMGEYLAQIIESAMKTTKSGLGRYLQLTFQIMEGEQSGRLLWSRLNIENPNDTTVRLARSELSAICRAVGVLQPIDSVQLHSIPLRIGVALKRDGDAGLVSYIAQYSKHAPASGEPVARAAPWSRPAAPLPPIPI